MRVNRLGEIVAACWADLPRHFEGVALDTMVVMPNHMHGIIVIGGAVEMVGAKHLRSDANASPLRSSPQLPRGTQSASLGAMVQNFKSVTTRKINAARGSPRARFWQRNYWEHVVRDEVDLARIRDYISSNPARWEADALRPAAGTT